MDWQLLALSFVTVFLAELGDKSQLAVIALSGNTKSTTAVFLGTSAALVMASAIGVVMGGSAALILPTLWVKGAAAAGFGFMGVRLLWPKGND
ncbi:MAG: TMEM165/GDT1 family protein [Cyanobacteria bacterium P01_H01_bin.130]